MAPKPNQSGATEDTEEVRRDHRGSSVVVPAFSEGSRLPCANRVNANSEASVSSANLSVSSVSPAWAVKFSIFLAVATLSTALAQTREPWTTSHIEGTPEPAKPFVHEQ